MGYRMIFSLLETIFINRYLNDIISILFNILTIYILGGARCFLIQLI